MQEENSIRHGAPLFKTAIKGLPATVAVPLAVGDGAACCEDGEGPWEEGRDKFRDGAYGRPSLDRTVCIFNVPCKQRAFLLHGQATGNGLVKQFGASGSKGVLYGFSNFTDTLLEGTGKCVFNKTGSSKTKKEPPKVILVLG